MSNYASSNKAISNKITDKDNTPNNADCIIILCSFIIRETSQGILPTRLHNLIIFLLVHLMMVFQLSCGTLHVVRTQHNPYLETLQP